MTQPEVVVLSGVRTAIGDFGGGFKGQASYRIGSCCCP